MAWYAHCRTITVEAGSAILPYRFIVRAADGQVDYVAAAQGDADGISAEEQPTVGRDLPMVLPDGCLAKIEAGAAITDGALVSSDNVGRAIPHVAAVDNVALGRLYHPGGAAAAGNIVTIQFVHKRTDAG